ncbi:unnamed protein product [Periconia digitata]|uniref:lytic cellulose monooxygenase (C4-dehydrogenating) n=1 Tax=Periconia digitata TaxID=1303443 RepID=A0A9W4UCC7_9PLEO|nr:unnamed protein product [Periconia digitata]
MKITLQQLTLLALQGLHQANGHYFGPNWDYSGETAMCGRNATLPLFGIETLKLEAGSTIGFAAMSLRDEKEHENLGEMNFTIPASTPPGKYLFRAEHLNINSAYKVTEMYINCAHIEVTGSGSGTPGPVTKFPGAFDARDPGIWLPGPMMRPVEPLDELKNWQGAGPAVWRG